MRGAKLPFKQVVRDFLGGPVVGTPRFQCRGCRFKSLVGELRSHMPRGQKKKKKKWWSG